MKTQLCLYFIVKIDLFEAFLTRVLFTPFKVKLCLVYISMNSKKLDHKLVFGG